MISKITQLAIPIMSSLIFIFFATPVYAQDPLDGACDTSGSASPVCDATGTTVNPITGDDGITNAVARILAMVIGIVSGIMLILGGLAFVTSGGNAESEAKAKRRVIYGVVGIAVAALAWTLISFIVARLL